MWFSIMWRCFMPSRTWCFTTSLTSEFLTPVRRSSYWRLIEMVYSIVGDSFSICLTLCWLDACTHFAWGFSLVELHSHSMIHLFQHRWIILLTGFHFDGMFNHWIFFHWNLDLQFSECTVESCYLWTIVSRIKLTNWDLVNVSVDFVSLVSFFWLENDTLAALVFFIIALLFSGD